MKRHAWLAVGWVVGVALVGAGALPVWADTEETGWPVWDDETGSPKEGKPTASLESPPDLPEAGASTETSAAVEEAAPVEEAEPPPAGEPGRLVSVDFKDADIRQVLRIISLKSGVDIVAGADVEGLVSIKLTNVPWEQALDILLRTYGFTYERKGNIVRVMTLGALEQEALATDVFPLNYATAKEVPDVIQEMLSDRGRVKFDERTNTVIVTDVPSTLFQIQEVVARLDQRTPQVLIESRIVETKLEKTENLGIDWSDSVGMSQTATAFGSSFPFPGDSTLGGFGDKFLATPVTKSSTVTLGTLTGPAMSLTLNALKQRTDTRIVSNPTLTVLNNQEAKIHIGEEYPIPSFSVDPSTGRTIISGFETRTIGTVLTVTPHVNQSQEIVVDLKPEVITALSEVSFDVGGGFSAELPRFSTQTVSTQVRILDGNTIAIGGLVKETKVKQNTKVPVLGDIPIIGFLFTNRREFDGSSGPALQQDLLIFLTVTLEKQDAPRRTVASTAAQ